LITLLKSWFAEKGRRPIVFIGVKVEDNGIAVSTDAGPSPP